MKARVLPASLLVAALLAGCTYRVVQGNTKPATESVGQKTGGSQAGKPGPASVRNDRFVETVKLDGGLLRVDPPPASLHPSISLSRASAMIWASPIVQGVNGGSVFGFGLISTGISSPGVPKVQSAPAWIGFAWGGVYFCPMIPATPGSHPELPNNGYVAVAIGADGGPPALTYSARSSVCGDPDTGPRVAFGTHVVSIPWLEVGRSGDILTMRYLNAPCGRSFLTSGGGDGSSTTIAVEVTVPDLPLPCPRPRLIASTWRLPGAWTRIAHAPVGIVRQIQLQP